MKVVVAIDSFKGSLSSISAGNAVKEAVLKLNPTSQVTVFPLADGGEGTVDALCEGLSGEYVKVSVTGPNCSKIEGKYCICKNNVAVIEMASAAGITHIPEEERNPLETTTYGVGELIKDAISRGCRDFIIGLGGSATNDGGVGMLMALGFEFFDANGASISLGAKGLETLCSISDENVISEVSECRFRVACDVTNPLCGDNGCSAIFGPQKGATESMIKDMDRWLNQYAKLSKTVNPNADKSAHGTGAAGGLGFAFLTYLNSTLESGINIILEELEIEKYIADADVVVTGEGRLDAQTVMGKAPIGVARLAKKHGKKVIAFSGCVTEDAILCNDHGIDAYFPIVRGVTTLDEALDTVNAYKNLVNTAYQVFRLINI